MLGPVRRNLFSERLCDNAAMLEAASCEFESIFYAHDGLPSDKWHHYLAVYDRHVGAVRDRRRRADPDDGVRLLEIGVMRGGSLEVWRRYLGPSAIIHGLDIDETCEKHEDRPDLVVHIGDQKNEGLLERIATEMGGLDVVVDDGGHFSSDQIRTFEALYPLLASDGVYVCEDTHTSYWPEYGGSLKHPRSFIEYAKDLVDHIHAWHADGVIGDAFARATSGVFFYDSMVVVERGDRRPPRRAIVGQPR